MNILVVNVSLRPTSPVKFFPIGLGYITTAMKNAGFQFDLLDIDAHRHSDEETERIIRRKAYDVVCLGCIVTGYRIVKSLASLIKTYHPHATVIAGNSVATSVVDTLLKKTRVDIAVMGEGDETIVELLQSLSSRMPLDNVKGICFLRNGEIVRTLPRGLIKDLSSLPFIDYSLFDIETYIETSKFAVNDPLPIPREEVRALPINTARGCISNCSFCYHVFNRLPYRYRSPKSLVTEMKQLIGTYGINNLLLWDELTFFSKKQALAFAETMIEEKVHVYWVGNCRGNLFDREDDLEIMEKMKQAGCIGMGYSLESADPGILRAMNKHMTVEQFSLQTRLLQRAGIPTTTSLVFGFPQESPETIRKTFDCCIENRIYPSVGYLLPQPGSRMYDYAREKRMIPEEEDYLLKMGDRQDLRVNLTGMTDEAFETHIREGLTTCNELLGIGLDKEQLIKTQYYRNGGSRKEG